MSMKDYDRGRMEGMTYALRQLKEGMSVDELAKEIKWRYGANITLPVNRKDLETACVAIKEMTFDTVLALSCAVMVDEFGWGPIRLERYIDGFSEAFETLVEEGNMIKWYDIINNINYYTGIQLKVRWNDNSGTVLLPDDQTDVEGSYQWKKAHRKKKPHQIVCAVKE